MTSGDFDIGEYFTNQQREIAGRKGRNPRRHPTEVIVELPVVSRNSQGAFEVKGKGNPDAALTGSRPKNPEEALIQKEGKGS